MVERPKYLLNFEHQDIEKQFLSYLFKEESRWTIILFIILQFIYKIIIGLDIFYTGEFYFSVQLIIAIPLLIYEYFLFQKIISNP